jgi:hypothetical protein
MTGTAPALRLPFTSHSFARVSDMHLVTLDGQLEGSTPFSSKRSIFHHHVPVLADSHSGCRSPEKRRLQVFSIDDLLALLC